MMAMDALETGDLALAEEVWSADDSGVNADGASGASFVSAQFMAGLRWLLAQFISAEIQ